MIQAEDLPGMDMSGILNYLIPETFQKFRYLRPLRQTLSPSREEKEGRNEGSPENAEPRLQ